MTNARTAKSARDKAAQLRAEAARREARRRSVIALSVVTLVVLVIAATFVLIHASKTSKTESAIAPANLSSNGSIVVGQPTAPVTLVAYEDFQCPACEDFEQGSAGQIQQWVSDGTVKVEYRPIAFLDRMSSTGYSTRALNIAAALVNSDPAAFAAFHASLYTHQPKEGSAGLTDAQLIQYAVDAGGPRAALEQAAKNGTYKAWAAKTTDAASKAGVVETPTLIVNGQKLKDHSPATVKKAVEAAAKG